LNCSSVTQHSETDADREINQVWETPVSQIGEDETVFERDQLRVIGRIGGSSPPLELSVTPGDTYQFYCELLWLFSDPGVYIGDRFRWSS
jgi:hypothetical protein